MKTLKIILLIIVIAIGGFSIWMATLPNQYEVRRETTINAPIDQVFSMVNDFKEWESWSPWLRKDSSIVMTFGDLTSGVGAMYSWTGDPDISGEGSMTITLSEPNQAIEYDLNFITPFESESKGYFRFEAVEGGTKVSWGDMGKVPFFIRFMDFDAMIGPDFEDGLRFMREIAEANATAEPTIPIEIVTTEAVEYYYVSRDGVAASDIGPVIGAGYGEIMAYLAEDANNYTGHPFTISRAWDENTMSADMDICLPIKSSKPGSEKVMKSSTVAGRAVRGIHYGNYDKVGPVYYAIEEYIAKNELKFSGFPREIYVTDPGQEPDTAKWVTYVEYPIE